MKLSKQILCLPVMLLLGILQAHAQDNGQSPVRPKYELDLVRIIDADSTEYVFVVGKVGFKSVASLKRFLSNLPPGSTLEWNPGCRRFGDEPLLSSAEDIEDFRAFCSARKISFILVRSG
jgi:hypothetical protein